jgi:hypothetical protein
MTIVIDFAEARQRLQPPQVPHYLRAISELSLEQRQYNRYLPFTSGLPTWFLEGDRP